MSQRIVKESVVAFRYDSTTYRPETRKPDAANCGVSLAHAV